MSWSFGQGSGPRTNPPDSNPYIHLQPQSHTNPEAPQSTYSPPLAFQSNYSAVGPSHPHPPAAVMRSFDSRTHQRPSIATPSHYSKHQGPRFPATATLSQFQSTDENPARNSGRRDIRPSDTVFGGRFQSVSQRASPPVLSGNHYSREIVRPVVDVHRQRPPGPLFDDDIQPASQRTRSPPSFPVVEVHRQRPPGPLFDDDVQPAPQRTRSPPSFPVVEVHRQRPPGPLFDDDIQPAPQRTRSPPSFPGNYPSAEIGHFMEPQRPPGVIFNDRMQSLPQRTRPPPQFSGKNRTGNKVVSSFEPPRPVLSSPVWSNQTRPSSNFNNTWFGQDQSPHNSRRHVSVTRVDAQALTKTRSPPVPSANENAQENTNFSRHGLIRPSVSPPGSRTKWKDLDNFTESPGSEIPHMFPPSTWSIKNDDGAIKSTSFPSPKRPPLLSTAQIFQGSSSAQDKSEKRPSISPPGFVNGTNSSNDMYESPTFEVPRMSLPSVQSNVDKSFVTKPTNVPAPKRNRSPPLISGDRGQGNSSPQDDSEREMQAKAKRLARFKVELSQPVDSTAGIGNQNSFVNRQDIGGTLSADMDGDFDDTVIPDHEGPKSTTVITGLCPDMCPVSEREERERKGDLDRYERLDGDRNRTNKSLAVKKYNRTAEREANLIRPMPVLKKTIDYLLYLLDQPYDEKFLGLYNFLWDRMRAIRMDLRMQHLFNLDSITMLEQMIRLHIVAMHELCEYTKGEGFSEGFDAHLNIEQMNKTSVELFQLYDDHRKKGINVPTEKEFRGYYALLKLDKHPGYKVEPAELSHDLSKMTPAIRQTREVLFARDVARSCRTGNFIAFFRLARKASYLQACLMHAHFAKLRTQALASLHSGLQSNQGIPVALIAKWLALEGEDMESLLEHHGFLIREFDEPYMVKDGQFLNCENDFPLKCSELVHAKKADMISEDIASSISTMSSYAIEAKEDPIINSVLKPKPILFVGCVTTSSIIPVDEVMDDNEVLPSPKSSIQVKPIMKTQSFGRKGEKTDKMTHVRPPSWDLYPAVGSPKSPQGNAKSIGKSPFSSVLRNSFGRKSQVNTEVIPMQVTLETINQEKLESPRNASNVDNSVSEMAAEDMIEDKQLTDIEYEDVELDEVGPTYDEEVAEAKLRLIFRIWRRHSLRRKELREERQLAAVAALSSLSLGPPIRQSIDQLSTSSTLNIDQTAKVRYKRHEKSWSSLNVSEVIADALSRRTSSSKCYCWKMILCSQSQDLDSIAVSWLRSKLMPMKKDGDYDLITSSPDLSIWKRWIPDKNGGSPICYLSVRKEAEFGNLSETMLGSSAILFFISEGLSLEMQRIRLHEFVSSLPSDSHLPLLIIIDSYEVNSNSSTVIADQLALNNIDKSLVSDYSVVFLKKNQVFEDFDGFFSDEELRKGLKWLANHSPLPPNVRGVKTRDLIGVHLSPSMRVLDEIGAYDVGPNQCISAFNESLNRTIANIVNAANANRCSWPCPEIDSIDKTSDEYQMVNLHLPLRGWSSSGRINQLVSVLEETKLPEYEDDFSWLYRGGNSRNELENQKLLLENSLVKYLAQTSKTMGLSLATNEARVMIQKNAHLELHGSTYYIVPIWAQIFRRTFNWRLMSVSTGDISTTYVLEHDMDILALGMEKPGIEEKSSPQDLIRPSLDEMIDRCTEIEVFRSSPFMVSGGSKVLRFTDSGKYVIGKLRFDEDDILEETDNGPFIDQRSNETTSKMVVGSKPTKEVGRLDELFEHCNFLQNKIDKKLSIYF